MRSYPLTYELYAIVKSFQMLQLIFADFPYFALLKKKINNIIYFTRPEMPFPGS